MLPSLLVGTLGATKEAVGLLLGAAVWSFFISYDDYKRINNVVTGI